MYSFSNIVNLLGSLPGRNTNTKTNAIKHCHFHVYLLQKKKPKKLTGHFILKALRNVQEETLYHFAEMLPQACFPIDPGL